MVHFNKRGRPKDDGCNKRQDGNSQSSPSNDKQIDNVKISCHGSSLKTHKEMNMPASYELHVCTLTYRGVVKSLSYSHEKQVPYHAMKHTISSKNKGSNLHFRCVFLSSRFLLSQRDTWNRLLGSNFVYLQVMIGCGRWKIGNNNNELTYIYLWNPK